MTGLPLRHACATTVGGVIWCLRYYWHMKIRQIGNLFKRTRKKPNEGRVYDPRGLAPALSCMGGGNRMPFIIELQEHRSKGLKRCKNLEWMLERGIVPISHAVWVDAYNKICARVSGTISTRTDPSNQRFVTELYEKVESGRHDDLHAEHPSGELSPT